MEKVELRHKFLRLRKALTEEEWQEKSDRLCKNLIVTELWQKAETVLGYRSIHREPSLESLFSQKQWGLPRCVKKQLQWHYWQNNEPLAMGKYGIKTPFLTAPKIPPQTVDLILVPALACDKRGYRLGYGGGYYDRLFCQEEWTKIPRIGVIFDFALTLELPVEPWDQKLQAIVTDRQFYPV